MHEPTDDVRVKTARRGRNTATNSVIGGMFSPFFRNKEAEKVRAAAMEAGRRLRIERSDFKQACKRKKRLRDYHSSLNCYHPIHQQNEGRIF